MTEATSPATALVDALSGIDCPVTRAEQIGRVARDFGNLPPTLALLRGRALDEAVAARHRVADLAERLDISEGRLYEILRQFRARIRATVSDPTKTKKRGFNEPLRRQQSMADVLGQSCLQQILFKPLRAVH